MHYLGKWWILRNMYYVPTMLLWAECIFKDCNKCLLQPPMQHSLCDAQWLCTTSAIVSFKKYSFSSMPLKGNFCSHHDAFHNYVFYFNANEREIHCTKGKSPPSVAYIWLKLAHLYHTSQRRSWQKWAVFILPVTKQGLEVLVMWVGEWESGSPPVLASTLAGGFSVIVQYSQRISSLLDHLGR
jgi:hypothetical protein